MNSIIVSSNKKISVEESVEKRVSLTFSREWIRQTGLEGF